VKILYFLNPIQASRKISYVAAISLQCLYKHYTTKDTYIHADSNPQTQR